MNSAMGTASLWALRTSLLVILLFFPLMAGITYNWLQLKSLNKNHEQTQRMLFEHRRAEQKIKEKTRQLEKTNSTNPIALKSLFPLGTALGDDIAILTLNASFKKHDVRLNIAAKSLPALFDFIARLQKTRLHVELQHHQIAKNEKQDWPIMAEVNIHLPAEVSSEN
ncbi:hypothetical protein EXT68_02830 [Pectobacterium parmentieri]|uniref:Uncharacterized protein n=1 Tax=Pectobacterium parmentieri TaxID=1905730 RepID=A0A0H3I4N3_PECPM|nr:hypothetical protein [Pectobacterium parmentieri]AFI89653.1 Hypothetical protein W5S_1561 [Pectobacterium parmentieri]MBI0472077.1 hypothetical protein [Pectobacterium parmentieri]MBI0495186.1 hypothetical protein [Pectobacterium parmentieri]MBI0556238.1 hypothetical protein [Pectobacterium parmentieri]MBI0569322.1 hypothetical protein [Pectobacterium parmentieri]